MAGRRLRGALLGGRRRRRHPTVPQTRGGRKYTHLYQPTALAISYPIGYRKGFTGSSLLCGSFFAIHWLRNRVGRFGAMLVSCRCHAGVMPVSCRCPAGGVGLFGAHTGVVLVPFSTSYLPGLFLPSGFNFGSERVRVSAHGTPRKCGSRLVYACIGRGGLAWTRAQSACGDRRRYEAKTGATVLP